MEEELSLVAYRWVYDDGSCQIVIVDDEEEKLVAHKRFSSKNSADDYYKQQKDRWKKQNRKMTMKKIKVAYGLKNRQYAGQIFPNHYFSYLNQVDKLVCSCGMDESAQRTMIMLFSGLLCGLSAYLLFLQTEPFVERRPPQLQAPVILVNDRNNSFDILCDVVASICDQGKVDTQKWIKMKTPAILPRNRNSQSIEDSAFVKVFKTSGYDSSVRKYYNPRFPAQYRDTGVILNSKYYKAEDIKDFQRRNPWTTIILYGANSNRTLVDAIRLDSKVLSRCNLDRINLDALHTLIQCYQRWLANCKKSEWEDLESLNNRIKDALNKHNQQKGIIRITGLQREWYRVQMLALCLFEKFLADNTNQENIMRQQSRRWLNLLLPGVFPEEDVEKELPLEKRTVVKPERDGREIFEKALTRILEEGIAKRFLYVRKKEQPNAVFDKTEYWGVIRKMKGKKMVREQTVLIIPWNVLIEIGPVCSPVRCDWQAIIKQVEIQKPTYLHPEKNNRLYSGCKSERAITLYLEKLSFLDADMKKSIKPLISEG